MNEDIELNTQGFSIAFDSPGFDVRVSFLYSPSDPLAIRSYISDAEDPYNGEEWIFGRDILIDGLDSPSLSGDVKVRPVDDEFISLTLTSGDDSLEIFLPIDVVRFFVEQTLLLVPRDEENIYIPDTVAQLLG